MYNQYKNYISLGYFCEVAKDLEQLGLRNTSSPFDWCISNFQDNIKAIDNGFWGFMEYKNLEQSTLIRSHYRDRVYHIYFFHDFSQYKTLEQQYRTVKDKYNRRITRFLKNIQEPTLFFRYISSELTDEAGKSLELKFIEENQLYINDVIKRYNPKNEIIYIGDTNTTSNKIKIYNIQPDDGDLVSRHPIINNIELYSIIKDVEIIGRAENIERFNQKQKRKNSIPIKFRKRLIEKYQRVFLKPFEYKKTYTIPNK